MPRRQHYLLLFLFLAISYAAQAEKYALVIGIGSYSGDSGLPKLYADDDSTALQHALESQGWTVYLMNSYSGLKQQPNRANILRTLGIDDSGGVFKYGKSAIPFLGDSSLTQRDTLLFYYGGHGTTLDDGTNYLIPRDVQSPSTKSQLISLNVVQQALDTTGAGNVVVLTDACRTLPTRDANAPPTWSRGATGRPASGRIFELNFPTKHYLTLLASRPGKPSYEMSENSSGVFTYYIVKALEEPDSTQTDTDRNGCLSLRELAQYATDETTLYSRTKLNTVQEPITQSDGSGWDARFCVAKYRSTPVPGPTPTPVPPPPPPSINSFSVSQESLQAGEAVTLSWSVSNATRIMIEPGLGVVGASGSRQLRPAQTTTYSLTATGNGGKEDAQVTVTIERMQCHISATRAPWYPAGDLTLYIDGKDVGSISYGPYGSDSLDFDCDIGPHQYTMEVSNPAGITCTGALQISKYARRFTPGLQINAYTGQAICILRAN